MLFIIALAGLLFTLFRFRQPGVKFWTPVTIFNRKEKLTPTGAKLYVACFVLLAIGLAFNFADRKSSKVSDTKTALQAPEVIHAPSEQGAESPQPAGETTAQIRMEQFRQLSGFFQSSAETIAGLIAYHPLAQSQLEQCNALAATGVSEFKLSNNTDYLRTAVRDCSRMAQSLCQSSQPVNAGTCEEHAGVAAKVSML